MIGSTLGNYQIVEKLGEGGMGAVYKGVDMMLEREVAIKMLRPELASQPQVVERFRSEAVTLAKLNHPNIATLYNFLREVNDFFMVMEFVKGMTLEEVIRRQGAMPVERAVGLFAHALEGIDHAHRMGIVHRDIKPANMMLTDTGALKVMDFGIARVLGTSRMTKQGNIIGTVEYMSPEQVRGEECDARSDIYSLGILLYEMLTGRVPFESKSEFELMRAQIEDLPTPPRTFAAHIPLAIEQAIMRSLAKRPEARFQTAGEFRAALENGLRAATNPMGAPVYAAPKTTPLEPTLPMGGGASADMKETRLATGAVAGQIKETRLPGPVVTAPNQVKETRLPGPGAYPHPPAHVLPQAQQASFFNKLNWAHYAGAVAVLLALVGVPAAMFISRSSPPAQAPAAMQPTAQEPAPAAPAEQTPAPTQEQPATSATPPVESQPLALPPDTDPGASAAKPARPRGKGTEQAEQATPGTTPTEPPATAATPPQPAPAPTEEKSAAKEPEKVAEKKEEKKAEEEKDKKKKSGGFFGGLKKIFGGDKDDKDKKDKKKKEQQNP